ncbi:response regulator [Antrihabitans cavernicola]|uniref:Response regulator transcription factor n=1 Tax=Antrihabitans cavernicola TaxID=2495913 RepID=A0A5A7S9J5_9NOCA|nr:response regulator transcription factor [Spelaeibacter cavernicola]KAA0020122.1 response regulator transcription factor [Spelaeibacter cavernicola]
MTQNPIRILVADDHTMLREALCDLLRGEPDFEIVAEAGTGTTAIRLAGEHRPDVLLLDLEMPESNPPETVRRLLAQDPTLRIIILSMHDGQELVQQLVSLGVRGYLNKGAGRHTLVSAIRQSMDAGPQAITLSVSLSSLQQRADEPADPSTLSTREREVLALVAEALSNRQVAGRLGVTEATIKRHLRNIFTKLEAVSRIDAVNRAVERGYIPRQGGSSEGVPSWR